MILYERRLRGREKRERDGKGKVVGLSCAGQGGGVGGWGVAN